MLVEKYVSPFTDFAERRQYFVNNKYYWDTNNVINTAKREGKEEGKEELRNAGILKALKSGKLTIEEIADFFETTTEEFVKIGRQVINEPYS